MIDTSRNVVLQLRHLGHDLLCAAHLEQEGGRIYAVPFQPAQSEQPFRPKRIRIEESELELSEPDEHSVYNYRGLVIV